MCFSRDILRCQAMERKLSDRLPYGKATPSQPSQHEIHSLAGKIVEKETAISMIVTLISVGMV